MYISQNAQQADPYSLQLYANSNQDIIADIRSHTCLEINTAKHSCTQNVTDAMKSVIEERITNSDSNMHVIGCTKPIIISAPTGSGKTSFAIKYLAEHAKKLGQSILLIVNRKILRDQLIQMMEENLLGYSINYCSEDEGFARIDNIIICNYQQFAGTFDGVINRLYQKNIHVYNSVLGKYAINFGYIVMDEAHYFVADSSFGGNTREIFRNILRLSYYNLECHIRYKNAQIYGSYVNSSISLPTIQRIYMTATPDYVRDIIAFEEQAIQYQLRALCYCLPPEVTDPQILNSLRSECADLEQEIRNSCLPTRIEEHVIEQKPRNLNLRFYYNQETIVTAVKESDKNEKWLIFVSDKQEGDALKKRLGSSVCSFIYSDTKRLEARDEIAVNRRFDKKVLIATTVLDNGVSLEDDDLKNIVIDTTDKVQLIQMLGRKRLKDDERITLYLRNKEERYFKKYLKHIDGILRNIDMSLAFSVDFENEIIQKDFVGEKYFSFDPRFNRHLPSPYSRYYLRRKRSEYVKMKSKLQYDKNAFAKQACEWLMVPFQEYAVRDKDSVESAWEEIEALIKPYVGGEKLSRADAKILADKMLDIIRDIKYGSKINTEDDQPKASINHILEYFGNKGFNLYKLKGKNNYPVILLKEGKKKASESGTPSGIRDEREDDLDDDYDEDFED